MTCITESSSEITHNVSGANFHKTGLRTCLERVFLSLVYFFPYYNLVSTPQPGCHCVFQIPLAVANIKNLASVKARLSLRGTCQNKFPVHGQASLSRLLITTETLSFLTCWPQCITSISIVMEPPRRGE